ncbi:MAG: DNA alkylation repair protein [Oscillospiraceae bacterium]|nr:DNA alkylation repair protein [Candidatus Equicaccousia limihippi]
MNICEEIQKSLFDLQDLKYREFTAKLTPNISIDDIIGVRIPQIRVLAKTYCKNQGIDRFLSVLPHRYYEENNLHACILCECKDYNTVIKYLDDFLPYINNWATCDILSPKIFKKHKEELKRDIDRWLNSSKTYVVRFGIEMAMSHFLDDDFDQSFLDKSSEIISDEYYVNMMIAWYFATALAKQWDATVKYLTDNRLPVWVHNKTIQKAVESYRITDDRKEFLRSLKIKNK